MHEPPERPRCKSEGQVDHHLSEPKTLCALGASPLSFLVVQRFDLLDTHHPSSRLPYAAKSMAKAR